MVNRIILREVARIILPFSIFMGLFSHGAVPVVGFGLGALCVCYEIKLGRRKPAPSVNEFESA
jgi:hypothetical protein